MEPPDQGDPSREDPRRSLSAGNQRYFGADSQQRSLEPLQESPGGGGRFLPSQRLFTSAAGVSLATGSSSQPCAHLFPGLLVSAKLERQWRQRDQTIEVHNLLRQLQTIRLGRLEVEGKPFKMLVSQVPSDLNATL